MNENYIIKALNNCAFEMRCSECPGKDMGMGCIRATMRGALDLINHLKEKNSNLSSDLTSAKAEIERLQRLGASATRRMLNARTEAIKEFVEKLKKEKYYSGNQMGYGTWVVEVESIDSLVKEMVGKRE